MKLAKVKCPNCGKMINREEGIPYNKRYYCNDDCLFEAIGEDLYDQHMFYLHFQRIFDRIPSNLEWCSPKYNSNYGTRNDRVSNSQKEGNNSIARKVVCKNTKEVFNSLKEAKDWCIGDVTGICSCCQ